MGSKDKFFGITSADKGVDDVGIAQASGTISAIGSSKTAHGRWVDRLMLTVNDNTALLKGQPIRITNLDSGHNGLTRILAIPKSASDGTGTVIVNILYNPALVDATGNWDVTGGAGAWDAIMADGADVTIANLALTYWDPAKQGGNELTENLLSGKIYVFPGIIKTIQITTAGNVRLTRSATLRPWGKDAQ